MKRSLLMMLVLVLMCYASFSQYNIPAKKAWRISSGLGFSNSLGNSAKTGSDFWAQLSYNVIGNFSLATEFENMRYKHQGYNPDPLVKPGQTVENNNNISLLVKYNILAKQKLKFDIASGWALCMIKGHYYHFESTATTQSYATGETTYNELRIPLLAELAYPLTRCLDAQARIKFSTNTQGGNTYSGGIGLSLEL